MGVCSCCESKSKYSSWCSLENSKRISSCHISSEKKTMTELYRRNLKNQIKFGRFWILQFIYKSKWTWVTDVLSDSLSYFLQYIFKLATQKLPIKATYAYNISLDKVTFLSPSKNPLLSVWWTDRMARHDTRLEIGWLSIVLNLREQKQVRKIHT